ncbi:MAG TPA: heme exporter protein CcmB [Gemmatimonadaceae bacterium]|nr:heme exporter protein CcmB [Gemmatimonadaceae bacterium]
MAERLWAREFARVRAVAWKDLATERRTRANFNAVVFFAALTLLLFGFALGADTDAVKAASAGVLWLTVLFSGVLVFNRSYQTELDTGALELLLLYPGERWAIFAGKFIANLAFVLLVEAVILPLAVVLYHMPLERAPWQIVGVMLLGTVGFVTLGTFYAAMASRVRAREVLLPLLLFPMLVPVLIASVQATAAFLSGDVMGDSRVWVRLLVVFDAIFLVAALLAFEHVIEG